MLPATLIPSAVSALALSSLLQPPAAAAAQDPLELRRGDTICLLGNALAERMQHHGWLETRLQARFPDMELSVRNLGFGADALTVHQRTMNFGKFTADGMAMTLANERFVPWDRYLDHCGADVVFAFFGYNESFAGEAGMDGFRRDLESFVDHVLAQRYGGGDAPRLVLFGSIPQEDTGDPNLPDGRVHNARIELYNAVAAEVAEKKGVRFVDVYTPLAVRYAAIGDALTINGIHLTERGNAVLAEVIEDALFGPGDRPTADVDAIRAAVLEKNLLWFNRYRATDGYNVYGGRSRQVYAASTTGEAFSNWDVLQREMDHLDVLCANRDGAIRAAARGEAHEVDDSNAPPLIEVLTNKRGPEPEGRFPFLSGDAAIDTMTAAPNMRIELFADERQFPELVNPVQMAWDTRGRLWVAVWPTYTHWTPNMPMDDKLLILEDTDGDGRADECTAFADDLHNPTGFEFWNGGVLLGAVPDLVFLQDTDGDDRADVREHLLHGLSSGDTHHSANSFVLGPDGALYFQEGTFHQTQVESIYGPVRNHNGCVWRFEPRTFRVERYIPYNYANPHGHVFDRWGQDFMTDGTGNVNYYSLPFSGFIRHPDKHRQYFPFFQQRSRPCGGTEFLSSRHFPDDNQGSYLVANVIGFQGIFQYRVEDDGSGFGAVEMDPIVQSTDPNFRPVDIEVGPDGAIYFLDWQNPLIGHLQHHIRDPSRDAAHGRVYRVTYEGRELVERPPIAGQPIAALLELLESPEDRTRYAARIELSGRDTDDVVIHARKWVAELDDEDPEHEHHLLEALWLHQQHNRMDRGLLLRLLGADDPRARAAATRVLRYGRHLVPDAHELLAAQVDDDHPRVRLEVVVAASFFDTAAAASIALEALRRPMDRFLDYALGETMRALEPHWKAALREGRAMAAGNSEGIEYLLGQVGPQELVNLPRVPAVLQALLTRHGIERDERLAAAGELAGANDTSPLEEVLEAVRRVDAGEGAHAAHVLHDLGAILAAGIDSGQSPPRTDLVELAMRGSKPATRELAFAAWVVLDGSADDAWSAASVSLDGVESFLGAVPRIASADLRATLHDRVRPLMFALPAELAGEAGTSAGAGTGLEVAYFHPPPPDARLETLAGMSPQRTLQAPNFTIDEPRDRPDAFGMLFRGTVFVPDSGEYTFFTDSDDGSRLYVDGTEVVENDGAHGMRERGGTIQLGAGAHAIVVTYYDQSGGEGLVVSWKGPNFGKERISDERLGSDRTAAVRARAILAMAHVPGNEQQRLRDATRLLGDGTLLDPAIELVRAVPRDQVAPEQARAIVDTLAGQVSALPPEGRTAANVAAALEVGRELAGLLPGDEADSARERLSGLGGSVVLMRTLPHQMLYDLTEFWVEAGKPVSVVFQNNDVMPHNLVITAPDAMATVGAAAERLSGQPGAEQRSFIPEVDGVLWHTRLIFPGESERLTFVAPEAPGDYPFVCTYPGHWRVMNGVMHVADGLEGGTRVTRRRSAEAPAQARDFVRDWTMADLEPLLVDGWQEDRSQVRGRALFTEAGCIKCHSIEGEGAIAGPELTRIRETRRGLDLLRHIVEPSLEIVEGYAFTLFETEDGIAVVGRIVNEDDDDVHVVPTLLNPDEVVLLPKDEIVARHLSRLSPMPTGLLVTLDAAEILDLLAFLQGER